MMQLMLRPVVWWLWLMLAFNMTGCSKSPQGQVQFQSLMPAGEVLLTAGERVTFVASVRAQNFKKSLQT